MQVAVCGLHHRALGSFCITSAEAMEHPEDKDQDLEHNLTFGGQAMQGVEDRRDMLTGACVAEEMHCSVLYQLKVPRH